MNLTKGVVTREQAVKMAPDYVAFVEDKGGGMDAWAKMNVKFETLKRGQTVLTCSHGVYVVCRVSSLNRDDFRAVDGPIVRVSNGEFSWRVDGGDYAAPVAS